MRKYLSVGDIRETPLSKWSHHLFIVSLLGAYINHCLIKDEYVQGIFFTDRLCAYILTIEVVIVLIFRVPILIVAHVPALMPLLHNIKKLEAKVHRKIFGTHRITHIKVDKQPYVEGGFIRCGDPNCKLMHKSKGD